MSNDLLSVSPVAVELGPEPRLFLRGSPHCAGASRVELHNLPLWPKTKSHTQLEKRKNSIEKAQVGGLLQCGLFLKQNSLVAKQPRAHGGGLRSAVLRAQTLTPQVHTISYPAVDRNATELSVFKPEVYVPPERTIHLVIRLHSPLEMSPVYHQVEKLNCNKRMNRKVVAYVYVCMYMCACTYICTYIHVCICTYTYLCTYMAKEKKNVWKDISLNSKYCWRMGLGGGEHSFYFIYL